jgi:hypothetical protein
MKHFHIAFMGVGVVMVSTVLLNVVQFGSFQNSLDARNEFGSEATLIHAIRGSRPDRARAQSIGIVLTHDQNPGGRGLPSEKLRYFQSVHAGHTDIQKDQIREQLAGLLQSVFAIDSLAANGPTRL